MNCMAMVPVKGAVFEEIAAAGQLMTGARRACNAGSYLPQMTHCARCRADAVGFIGEDMTSEQHDAIKHFADMSLNPDEERRSGLTSPWPRWKARW